MSALCLIKKNSRETKITYGFLTSPSHHRIHNCLSYLMASTKTIAMFLGLNPERKGCAYLETTVVSEHFTYSDHTNYALMYTYIAYNLCFGGILEHVSFSNCITEMTS